jgi:prepilin-type N-terminal cleavage/methylation domain-containing protein
LRLGEGRRTGFTLVEVIVVLVILAILAAIAIPALTGYIDKAQWKELEMRTRTAKIAFQTMVIDQYSRDGGFTPHAKGEAAAGDFFERITSYEDGAAFLLHTFTNLGRDEFETLTTDKATVKLTDPLKYLYAFTDSSGAIKTFAYVQNGYFEPYTALVCVYIEDATSTDAATRATKASWDSSNPGMFATFTNGFNIYKCYFSAHPTAPGAFEKLY